MRMLQLRPQPCSSMIHGWQWLKSGSHDLINLVATIKRFLCMHFSASPCQHWTDSKIIIYYCLLQSKQGLWHLLKPAFGQNPGVTMASLDVP